MRFVDLFAGTGAFHIALSRLGHECVFASEIDDELRDLYEANFPEMRGKIYGDIRHWKSEVPEHDILCAGFPCQPFSKSGGQLGTKDETRGTLFHEILEILDRLRPPYVLLENVGNFGRHDDGRTWRIVRERLVALGYKVAGTEHKTPRSGVDWRDAGAPKRKETVQLAPSHGANESGPGLISPHHFGYPHHRERFYIVAGLDGLPDPAFPLPHGNTPKLDDIVQRARDLSATDNTETRLSSQQVVCIDHWNDLISALPCDLELPSFPLWGDELNAKYPFEKHTPWAAAPRDLGTCFSPPFPLHTRKAAMLELLPSYARDETQTFRHWKIRYIRQNREWWAKVSEAIPHGWVDDLKTFPPSLRKLEWNAKGEERDLWKYVLQFRPSGLRAKRYTTSPALVAMTATQIPILGPKKRFLTRIEGRRLQGLPDYHRLPDSRERTFRALGNAVHVDVVAALAEHLLAGAREETQASKKKAA